MSPDDVDSKPRDAVSADDPDRQVRVLEQRVEAIRGHLDGVVGELDQRWHRLWTLPPLVRRYARPLVVTGTVLAALGAGALIAGLVRRGRRRRQIGGRLRRYKEVAAQVLRDPERVMQPRTPSVGSRLLVAAGTAAASVLTRHLVTALVEESRRRAARRV